MTPEERARAFYVTHPTPDADWYRDDVLIPVMAHAIRAAIAEEREACAKAVGGITIEGGDEFGSKLLRRVLWLAAAAIRARG